jgi:hypothetical protein
MGFVARPDGIYVVGMAAVVLAALWAFGRMDGRAWAFAVGLAPTVLIGGYQTYVQDSRYAGIQRGLPTLAEAAAAAAALILAAVAVRFVRARASGLRERLAALDRDRWLRAGGLALVALFTLFLLLAWFREDLLGQNYRVNKERQRTRGYDELNLRRLSWFLTPVVLVAAVAALVIGVRERWSAARWALVLPGLIVAPVLIWEPRIAPDLMWWTRRYLVMVVPAFLLLFGALAAWCWERWGRHQTLVRVVTAVVVLVVGATMLRQSNDLWGHEEYDGSQQVVDALAEVGDDDAVFVWQGRSALGPSFAITPFTWTGRPALAGPPNPTTDDLLALQDALGGRPLYLVADGPAPPPGAADALVEERRIVGQIDQLDRTWTERPTGANQIPVDLTVWRLEPSR